MTTATVTLKAHLPEWQYKYVAIRPYPTYSHKAQIKVEAGLHYLRGNERPYFSVTGKVFIPGNNDCEFCGQIHDLLLPLFPRLAPVMALHLSDDDGTPTYATGNAWYWLAGYYGGADQQYHGGNSMTVRRSPAECLRIFAEYVRVPLETARELADWWRSDDNWPATQRWCQQWVETQKPRWYHEATEAIGILSTLAAEEQTALLLR